MIITLFYGALTFVGVTNVWFSGTLDWDTAQGDHWHCDSPVVLDYNDQGQLFVGGTCYRDTVFRNDFDHPAELAQ